MEASPAEVAEFGRVLSARLAGKSREDFAAAVATESGESVSEAAVSQWTTGKNEPTRNKVFAIEKVLGLKPGTLSRCLGYVPVGAREPRTVADVIQSDSSLDERGRRAILALYRELSRS